MSLRKPKHSIWLCIPVKYITAAVRGVLAEHPDAGEFAVYATERKRKHNRKTPGFEQGELFAR